ncbi:MAG TPA: hypothetical protein DCS33_00140 [Gammaproteobacteria bacterium]|jgi:hypothetical protein|nr:hypothetical protein [Pseudomonadales bacterium]MBT6480925.1 hypothetical protein [Gammaproteobacteria bacterium]MBT7225120.1 hypothetical protein [Gammaproteobacteria bacterium]MDB3908180.1 hypothetical protein [Gammaproteobacteria bacterium]HAS47709.1 hypothetical protein [Gammaproteobacteria bacterium]
MNKILPEVSVWYQELASGALFEVVAVDEDSSTIEIQMLDGELGEYDFSTWRHLIIGQAEAPEDWRTPYELNSEDRLYSDQVFIPENFSGALLHIEPDPIDLGDDFQILYGAGSR